MEILFAFLLLLAPFVLAWTIWRIIQLQNLLKPFKAITDANAKAKQILESAQQAAARTLTEVETESSAIWRDSAAKVKILATEQAQLTTDVTRLQSEQATLTSELSALQADLEVLNLNEYAKEFGIYEPSYNFDGSERYKLELQRLYERQKQLLKAGNAGRCDTEWMVEGSKTKGRRMIEQQLKLMLMAFNGETDSLIAKVRFDNVRKIEDQISKAFDSINKLGKEKQTYIARACLNLSVTHFSPIYAASISSCTHKSAIPLFSISVLHPSTVACTSSPRQRIARQPNALESPQTPHCPDEPRFYP